MYPLQRLYCGNATFRCIEWRSFVEHTAVSCRECSGLDSLLIVYLIVVPRFDVSLTCGQHAKLIHGDQTHWLVSLVRCSTVTGPLGCCRHSLILQAHSSGLKSLVVLVKHVWNTFLIRYMALTTRIFHPFSVQISTCYYRTTTMSFQWTSDIAKKLKPATLLSRDNCKLASCQCIGVSSALCLFSMVDVDAVGDGAWLAMLMLKLHCTRLPLVAYQYSYIYSTTVCLVMSESGHWIRWIDCTECLSEKHQRQYNGPIPIYWYLGYSSTYPTSINRSL